MVFTALAYYLANREVVESELAVDEAEYVLVMFNRYPRRGCGHACFQPW